MLLLLFAVGVVLVAVAVVAAGVAVLVVAVLVARVVVLVSRGGTSGSCSGGGNGSDNDWQCYWY